MKYLISQSHIKNNDEIYDDLDIKYQNYFSNYNIDLIPIKNSKNIKQSNIEKYLDRADSFDGIILSGSGDIDLTQYNLPDNKSTKFSEDRDLIESKLIDLAIQEDYCMGDATTEALIPHNADGTATIVADMDGILAGLDVALEIFTRMSQETETTKLVDDGNQLIKGQKQAFLFVLDAMELGLQLYQKNVRNI